jgi:hypothetical protein
MINQRNREWGKETRKRKTQRKEVEKQIAMLFKKQKEMRSFKMNCCVYTVLAGE